jgi:hypothetical protein
MIESGEFPESSSLFAQFLEFDDLLTRQPTPRAGINLDALHPSS